MRQEVRHIYCMPGLAADVSIFEFIKLPEDRYQIHLLPWKIPDKDELLKDYAKRMAKEVLHENCILIGVSFGGVLIQEMSKFLSVEKLIIVSSVKSKHELPRRMKFVRNTKMYRLFPTGLVSKVKNWEKLAIGDFAKKRAVLYQKYLSVNQKVYLDWAIKNLVSWDQEEPMSNIIHIHGDKDIVFPIQNIKNCITIDNGTHVMIINRARWFNQYLPEIIEGKLQ